ncbi:DUF2207 domain-containing protein [Marinimicrobium sp. ABcell2]|uniref:DUF2207 domain-containing protein n=1 Tax=Marinimicrobium sp. ABcell2 TaxID=3069751 RepID=UPI0027B62303|nr:DUF2207 domain-containing protein [Marinimicrobium sp. ABcell2]MDQ2077761.1 DUF2207 domain-containing protein [Marinimicrobium sp. ABcell2]
MKTTAPLLLLLIFLCAPVAAQERILNFHSDIQVLPSGELEVTETIRVRAEGNRIRRGIYRDFPTRYHDRLGNRVMVEFEPLGVERDGKPEPWFTENLPNGVRINTGDDRFLPTPLETTYTLRYRTDRQMGFFDNYDELYWNVTGTGWVFTIEQASARVQLPANVSADQLELNYYTGPQGSQAQYAEATVVEPGVVEFATTVRLQSYEGLTISVAFPKGIVAEPEVTQRFIWFLNDNRAQLFLILGLLAVFAFYMHQWQRKGRNPTPGPIFPRYYPPESFSPGGLRYLKRTTYDDRCFSADLVQLAVKGHAVIRREKVGRKDQWIVQKPDQPSDQELTYSEKILAEKLFSGISVLELDQKNSQHLAKVEQAHSRALSKRFKPRYFVNNGGVTAIGFITSIAIVVLGFLFATNVASVTLWALVLAFVPLNIVFGYLMPRPTEEGQRLKDHINGLILYMSVASKDEIARLQHRNPDEPPLNAERFESLLPFALALNVEDAWTDKFTRAVGLEEANAALHNRMAWYHGTRALALQNLGSDLGKSLSNQIASASTPPGTSSGVGGGGFSGGGGGGGGGGGR